MKKALFAPFAALAIATTVFASTLAVRDLNAEIAKVLLPFQNVRTAARLEFANIETDSERALAASVSAYYRKTGARNSFEIKVPRLSYDYGDGSSPTTKFDGAIKVDLTKIISQDQLNALIPGIEELIVGFSQSFTRDYGEAAQVEAKVTEKNVDSHGDFTSVKGTLKFSIDLAKLPANVKSADVPFLSGRLDVGLDVNAGGVFSAVVVGNPAHSAFRKDSAGLKELLERLLAKDARELDKFLSIFSSIDQYAGRVVDGRN